MLDAAYAEYVRANDYEAGIELVATTNNTVMTRTFSKIYGLASLRIGWAYCPDAVADAVNRIRGPFNVSGPAIAAGVASLEDRAHMRARCRRTTRSGAAACPRTFRPSASPSRQVLRISFSSIFRAPMVTRRVEADTFLQSRRIILRRVEEYGFPDALRMTIGTEDENLAVLDALKAFMGASGAKRQ